MRRSITAFAVLVLTIAIIMWTGADAVVTAQVATPTATGTAVTTATVAPAGTVAPTGTAAPPTATSVPTTTIVPAATATAPPAGTPAAPPASPPTAQELQFRSDLGSFLSGMQGVVTTAKSNPRAQAAFAQAGADPSAAFADAQQQLSQLNNGDQLAALQNAFDTADPNWKQLPGVLQNTITHPSTPATRAQTGSSEFGALQTGQEANFDQRLNTALLLSLTTSQASGSAHFTQGGLAGLLSQPRHSGMFLSPILDQNQPPCSSSSSCTGTFATDCSSTGSTSAGGAQGDFYASYALQQAASASYFVLQALPSVDEWALADFIVGVIYQGLNGTAVILEEVAAESYDCVHSTFQAMQAESLPVDKSGNIIPAASQASADTLSVSIGNINTTLATMNTNATTISGEFTTLINNLAAVQGTANTIDTAVTEIQSDAATLTTNLATANTTANTIDTKSNTTITNIGTFQSLSLRMQIEEALSSSTQPVSLFQLPHSKGGYLDNIDTCATPSVQCVATETIQREQSAGQNIGNAQSQLTSANNAFTAGNYLSAYNLYAKAYQAATG